jgi:hypothetical protein
MTAGVQCAKKKRHKGAYSHVAMEAEVGIEPAYTALQAVVLTCNSTTYKPCHPLRYSSNCEVTVKDCPKREAGCT